MEPQSQPVPAGANQTNILAIVASIAITGLIVGGGVYYLQAKSFQEEKQALEDRIGELESGLAQLETNNQVGGLDDQTKNWKIYRNEEYGYSISYPEIVDYKDISQEVAEAAKRGMGGAIVPDSYLVFGKNVLKLAYPDYSSDDGHMFGIMVFNNSDNPSASLDNILGLPISDDFKKVTKVDIGGVSWRKYKTVKNFSKDYDIVGMVDYGVNRGPFSFVISITPQVAQNLEKMEVIEQMFSGFEFIDNLSNWQTYRNTQYGFEFRYPSQYLGYNSFVYNENTEFSIVTIRTQRIPRPYQETGDFVFSVSKVDNPKGLGLDEWFNENILPGLTIEEKEIYSRENGLSSYYTIRVRLIHWEDDAYLEDAYISHRDGDLFKLSSQVAWEDRESMITTFDQILSTFKFVE